MSINCEVILEWNATPEQLTAVGAALWRWCTRGAVGSDIYQYLDNQALADLMSGKPPAPSQAPAQAERPRVLFSVPDKASQDRQVIIDSLRREVPAKGVQGIWVDGRSWIPIG
jgi:hypothetical protein